MRERDRVRGREGQSKSVSGMARGVERKKRIER